MTKTTKVTTKRLPAVSVTVARKHSRPVKTGKPSADAKTPAEKRAIVKEQLSARQVAIEDGLPETFLRKPGEKPKPLSPEGQKRFEEAAKKNAPSPTAKSAELLAEQKAVREQKAAIKRAARKAKAGVDTKAMPLTGKAAARAINAEAIAKSNVEPTKVPAGVTGKRAKAAAERAEKKARRIASAKAKRALPTPRDPEAAAHAEKVLRLTARKPNEGKRASYDWNGAREAAASGKIPSPPDFSANTHRVYRPALAAVVELVQKKDLDGLLKHRVEGSSSSPKAIKRYREIALVALKAKQAS